MYLPLGITLPKLSSLLFAVTTIIQICAVETAYKAILDYKKQVCQFKPLYPLIGYDTKVIQASVCSGRSLMFKLYANQEISTAARHKYKKPFGFACKYVFWKAICIDMHIYVAQMYVSMLRSHTGMSCFRIGFGE